MTAEEEDDSALLITVDSQLDVQTETTLLTRRWRDALILALSLLLLWAAVGSRHQEPGPALRQQELSQPLAAACAEPQPSLLPRPPPSSSAAPAPTLSSSSPSQASGWAEQSPARPEQDLKDAEAQTERGLTVIEDIAVAVLTFSGRQNESVPAILQSWASAFRHLYFFSNTSQWADSSYSVLTVPHDEDPRTGGPRSSWEEMHALHALHELQPDSPWYYKCDDDAWVDGAALQSLVSGLDSSLSYYIGSRLWVPLWPYAYCAGGCGYLLSNGLMRRIHAQLVQPLYGLPSDVRLGHITAQLNLSCLDHVHFFGQNIDTSMPWINDGEPGHRAALLDPIAFHYVQPQQQAQYEFLYHSLRSSRRALPPLVLDNYNHDVLWAQHSAFFVRPHPHWPLLQRFPDLPGMCRGCLSPELNWDAHCGYEAVCVVSYSLYGHAAIHMTGAVRNAELVRQMYPGWVARFYHDAALPLRLRAELEQRSAELVLVNSSLAAASMPRRHWRLLVAADERVDRFLIRDVDSRLSAREVEAVTEWQQSAYSVHVMRDHPSHSAPLQDGMWGAVRHALQQQLLAQAHKPGFLSQQLWPRLQQDAIAHDSFHCHRFNNSRPFPSARPTDFSFVHQTVDEHERPNKKEADAIRLHTGGDAGCSQPAK